MKPGRRLLPTLFGLSIVLALVLLRGADPYPVQALRDIAFDDFQRLSPRAAPDLPVRIVDIDDASLATIGQWPWPRNILAELTDRLTQLGAAAVVFDVLFPEPDRLSPARLADSLRDDPAVRAILSAKSGGLEDYDQEFATALSNTPSVLGFGETNSTQSLLEAPRLGTAVVGADPTAAVPHMVGTVSSLPVLVDAAHGLGSISLAPEGSVGTVRQIPMLWTNGKKLFPSLSLEALRVAIGASTMVVFADPHVPAVQSVKLGDFDIPTAADGSMWLYFHPSNPALYVPAKDVLGDDFQKTASAINGNIVFIGTSATGLLDIRGTPIGADMPGVEIHAQALEQILSHTFLTRADWVSGLEILAFVLIGVIMVLVILQLGPMACLIVGAALAGTVAAASWFAFKRYGLLVDPTFPLVGSFIVYSAMIFFQFAIADADKRTIRRAFGHYVAPALLTEIERNSSTLKLGGETRELSVMFLDVRNFTTLSEGFEPPKLVTLLNTLFGELGARITDQYGTIDKFIGDCIMAFWNAPVDVEQHARKACLAALGMRQTLVALNVRDAFSLRAEQRHLKEIAIGIGIATGDALVGNLGLETRFDYSCIGDTVNVASRVQDACKLVSYDILVVDETRAAAGDLAFLDAGSLVFKGKTSRQRIHILVGDEKLATGREFVALREAHLLAVTELTEGHEADLAIDRCRDLAAGVDARLAKFYETLRTRQGDYRFQVEF